MLWLMLALMLPESAEDVEDEDLRRQVSRQLDQTKATHGLVSFYQFQVYLLYQGLCDEESLDVLLGRLQFISRIWSQVGNDVFQGSFEGKNRHFPSFWNEAVQYALQSPISRDAALRKYLLYHGLRLAYTPTTRTKGKTFAIGTFIQFPVDFAKEIYASFLSFAGEGFPHPGPDRRFVGILATVNRFNSSCKAGVSQIIAHCRSLEAR